MQFEYIYENLNKILQNPDSILYFKPYDVGNKRALFAMVKEDQGIYKKVQITKEQSKMNFPWEPIYWFYKGPGYICLKNFMSLNNWVALNATHLDGFKQKTLNNHKIFNVGVFATFADGSSTFITRKTIKEFQKKGGIQSYIDLLKQYKQYEPQHDTYKFIEGHDCIDNTFIIPELQNKKEESKVKKLTNDKR